MGAMVRRDGLFACGVGTAAVGQREIAAQLRSSKSYECLRDGLRTGL